MSWGKRTIAALSLIGALIIGGCGDNGSEKAGGGAEPNDAEKTFRVGVTQFAIHPSLDAAYEGFKKALADEGLKVEYDFQSAQGDQNNTLTIANNFVGDNVDLIFANATASAYGAVNATKDIPIVFTSVTDPVEGELVESRENPSGNVTGTTDSHPDAIPNTIQFITDYFDGKNVGVVYNSGEQNSVAQIQMVKEAMEGTNLKLVEATVSTSAEVKQATESLIGSVDFIYIITDNIVVSAIESVVQVATDNQLPLFVGELDSVERGGFAAYGFDYKDIGYEAGQMAVQILKGKKEPSDLPIQYPQNLKLVINKEAAKNMGVEINDEWKDIAEFIN